MTDPRSHGTDNEGRCECCNRDASVHLPQQTYPVYLGGYVGGPKRGTMWCCPDCLALLKERDKDTEPGKGQWTMELAKRYAELRARPIGEPGPVEVRLCVQCNLRPATEGRRPICSECRRPYDRAWYARHSVRIKDRKAKDQLGFRRGRRAFIDWLKEVPCTDCGRHFPPPAMQFDHLSDKELNIGTDKWSVSPERLMKEIMKCEVVCACCHAMRTETRAGRWPR